MVLTKLSLFSGIGGDDLASDAAGIETVCFVERDKYCQKVLQKNFPVLCCKSFPLPRFPHSIPLSVELDIMAWILSFVTSFTSSIIGIPGRDDNGAGGNGITGENNSKPEVGEKETLRDTPELHINASHDKRETGRTQIPELGNTDSKGDIQGQGTTIDIIAGGFPCQPHSVAGKRKGSSDERNLWPEFRRIISEIKPRWVVAENVPGLFSSDAGRFFGEVLADLAALGYAAGWCTYGAVDVGALHRRNRVFIVAHAVSDEYSGRRGQAAVSNGHQDGYQEARGTLGQSEQRRVRESPGTSSMADSSQRKNNGRGRGNMDGEAAGRESLNTAVKSGSQDVSDTAGIGSTSGLSEQTQRQEGDAREPINSNCQCGDVSNANSGRCEQCNPKIREVRQLNADGGATKPGLGRVADGLSYWLDEPEIPRVATGIKDRVNRLKGLGNAVVPQQIYLVYKAIVEIESK